MKEYKNVNSFKSLLFKKSSSGSMFSKGNKGRRCLAQLSRNPEAIIVVVERVGLPLKMETDLVILVLPECKLHERKCQGVFHKNSKSFGYQASHGRIRFTEWRPASSYLYFNPSLFSVPTFH